MTEFKCVTGSIKNNIAFHDKMTITEAQIKTQKNYRPLQ